MIKMEYNSKNFVMKVNKYNFLNHNEAKSLCYNLLILRSRKTRENFLSQQKLTQKGLKLIAEKL